MKITFKAIAYITILFAASYLCSSDVAPASSSTPTTDRTRPSSRRLHLHARVSDFVYPNRTGAAVRVRVYRHTVSTHSNGVFVGRANELIGETTTTLGDSFSINVPAIDRYPDYLMITVSCDGYLGVSQILYHVRSPDCDLKRFRLKPLECYETSQSSMAGNTARYDLERALHPEAVADTSQAVKPKQKTEIIDWSKVVISELTYLPVDTAAWMWVYGLHSGYNSGRKFDKSIHGRFGQGLWLDRELFIAGVVAGELGSFTVATGALGAQAISARTYAQYQTEYRNPANYGHAFSFVVSDSVMRAVDITCGEIVTYKGKTAVTFYAARCSGKRTQSADRGMWAPYKSSRLYGTPIPYLPSVQCTGHCDCREFEREFEFRERPCRAGVSGEYIYGHGVGMCQRGAIEWAEDHGWGPEQIILHTYVGCKIEKIK